MFDQYYLSVVSIVLVSRGPSGRRITWFLWKYNAIAVIFSRFGCMGVFNAIQKLI